MNPNLSETITFPIVFENGNLITTKEYFITMISKKDTGDIAMACYVLDSNKAISDINNLIEKFIDKYASEIYEQVKQEHSQNSKEYISCKIPSDEDYAKWIKNQLDYEKYLDDFIELKWDNVAEQLPDKPDDIKKALINIYKKDPQKAWKSTWLSDEEIIISVKNILY